MARTLRNFLVGIGYDYDREGEREAASGIDRLRGKALQFGAVVAGAFGARALTSGFAEATDTLGKFSSVLDVSADDVNAFGNALGTQGGSLESFMSQLEGIGRLRAGLLTGDAGFIAAAGIAGIDTTELINAEDAIQAYLSLADQFAELSPQQRINAASALGLDDASIRLLSLGRDAVEELVEQQRRIRPVTNEMLQIAEQFNDATQDLSNNIGSFADQISLIVLPRLNGLIQDINGFVDENREDIVETIPSIFTGATTGAGAGLLLGAGATAGGVAGAAGVVAVEAGVRAIDSAEESLGFELPNILLSDTVLDFLTNSILEQVRQEQGIATPAPALQQRSESLLSQPLPQSTTTPTQGQGRSTIDVRLELDGEVLERRIIEVNERQNDQALEDIRSPIAG